MILFAQMAELGLALSVADATIIPLWNYALVLVFGIAIAGFSTRTRRLLAWLFFSFGPCLFPNSWMVLTLYVMSRLGLLDPQLFLSQNPYVIQLSYGVVAAILLGIVGYVASALIDVWQEARRPAQNETNETQVPDSPAKE
jgi:hypothetical protein